jgi:hypothetical protein
MMGIRKEGALQSQMQEKAPAEKQYGQCSNGRSSASTQSLKRGMGADEKRRKRLLDQNTGGIEAPRDV